MSNVSSTIRSFVVLRMRLGQESDAASADQPKGAGGARMTQWQPIDTIPVDTEVLIYVPGIPAIMIDEIGEDGQWQICDDDERVTHWMPLPEPPA